MRDHTFLLDELRGQQVFIEDLETLLPNWPCAISPDLQALRLHVCEISAKNNSRLKALRRCDVALFAAMWWPYASLDRLKVVTQMAIWMFIWDDETDSGQFSSLASEVEHGRTFRRQTLAYVQTCLGLTQDTIDVIPAPNVFIEAFGLVGTELRRSWSLAQRQHLYEELCFAVEKTGEEQECQLSGILPDLHDYLARRKGTSAVEALLAMTPYCWNFEVPAELRGNQNLKRVYGATNTIISVTNDILSLKKEIACNQLHSLVPVLCMETKSLQGAIDVSIEILKHAIESFEAARYDLELAMVDFEEDAPAVAIRRMIEGCQFAVTANLKWSLRSGRYGIHKESMSGGLRMSL